MLRALPFGLVFLLPASVALGAALGGAWTFFTAAFVFVLTPLVDAVLPTRTENVPDERAGPAWAYDAWLVLWVPSQLALIGYGLFEVTGGARTPLEQVGLTLGIGISTGGAGITIAHELMHRKEAWARALAEALMSSVTYAHFCVEHVLGHHKNVATPEDPASSRKGESVYAFLPRTLLGGLVSAWRLETKRCRSLGITPGSLRDRRMRYAVVQIAIYAGVFAAFGPKGALFFAAQSLVAVLLLEVINYVEHYGLARKKTASGRYERVKPTHSWNSPHRLTAYYLFNLPRHADHHYLASRPYRMLRHFEDSPQLPAGYAGMVVVALAPPLWRRLMDPRVDAYNAGRAPAAADKALPIEAVAP